MACCFLALAGWGSAIAMPQIEPAAVQPATQPFPVPGAARPAVPQLEPRYERLDCGLTIVLVENHAVPLVSVQLAVKAGRADEPRVQLGVATFTAEMLAKGTKGKDALAIAKAIDTVGGRLAVDASFEATLISCDALSRHVDVCLQTVSDMVRSPTFPAGEMPKVREQLTAEVRQRLDEAEGLFARETFRLLGHGRIVDCFVNVIGQVMGLFVRPERNRDGQPL